MEAENNTVLPSNASDEDLELYAYLQYGKSVIEKEGGHGRIEFRFLNEGHGMRLATKGYSITDKAYKHRRPNKRYGLYNATASHPNENK